MSEAPAASRSLTPRAAVALLTLQLRAAQKEADTVEAEVAALDIESDPALVELRGRLTPLLEERRRALAAELADARAAAAAVVATDTAVEPIADPDPPAPAPMWLPPVQVDDEPETAELTELAVVDWSPPVAAPSDESPAVEPDDLAGLAADTVGEVVDIDTVGEVVDIDTVGEVVDIDTVGEVVSADAVWSPWQRPTVAGDPLPPPSLPALRTEQPVTVTLDPDAFAKALAVAIATVVEQLPDRPATVYAYPPTAAPPAKKKSFWAHAWHADVMLAFVAMVIVIIVLLAWMA